MSNEYKFDDPENTACFVCDHVMLQQRPILFVSHDDDDGFWQFTCGHDDHSEANTKIISLKEATRIDNSINELHDLPLGHNAKRLSIGDRWRLFQYAIDKDEEAHLKNYFAYPNLSPEFWAARYAHLIGCGDLRRNTFPDKDFETWAHRLFEILHSDELDDLRQTLLTPEERKTVEAQIADQLENGF